MNVRIPLAALALCLASTVAFAGPQYTPASTAAKPAAAAAATETTAAKPDATKAAAVVKHKKNECKKGEAMVNGKCEAKKAG